MSLTDWRSCIVGRVACVTLFLVGCCVPAFAQAPVPAVPPSAAAASLAAAKSWGYQLQRVKPDVLAAIPYDLFVIDYSRDGTDKKALTAEEVAKLKVKPDGGRRIVLAYLSIGEAETYRYYWQPDWATAALAPPWLADSNKRYRTNVLARYWLEGWQSIVFRGENNYLDRILRAGFDGIYLDRVDVYQEFEQENPAAGEQMIAFVKAIAAHARSRQPGFLVVPQNAEELLEEADYRAVIDGIAKEDLLFGEGRSKYPNKPPQIETHMRHLKQNPGAEAGVCGRIS
jgi:cysteinyl-tRNA synthetase, unknown class